MISVNKVSIVAKRELKSYITSPISYLAIGIFFILSGIMFTRTLDHFDEICKRFSAEMVPLKLQMLDINVFVLAQHFANLELICIVFLPILTMRLISEEKRNKTIELLMTSPISSLEIILGKFLSMACIWLIILAITFVYPFILSHLPSITIDWSTYFSGMLGIFLYGLFGIAVGLFASTTTENNFISAIIAFAITATLYFIFNIGLISDSPFGNFLYHLSTSPHLSQFIKGIVDTSSVIYFFSAIFFALFLAERTLESQRWR